MADTKDDTKSPALMLSWSALTSTLPFERKKMHRASAVLALLVWQ